MRKVNSILYFENEQQVQKEVSEILNFYCNELSLASDGIEGLITLCQI